MAKSSTVIELTEWSERLATQPRPGKRAKARIWCDWCQMHHQLMWGEMRNAIIKHGARSLEEIVAAYSWKYCDVDVLWPDEAELPRGRWMDAYRTFELLKAALESYHPEIHVVEGCRRGDRYALTVRTPRGTYQDERPWGWWIMLVRRDAARAID